MACDLQGLVRYFSTGFKGSKYTNIAPRLPSVQEPPNRPATVEIAVPVVGCRVGLHAPSQEAAAKGATTFLKGPKSVVVLAT